MRKSKHPICNLWWRDHRQSSERRPSTLLSSTGANTSAEDGQESTVQMTAPSAARNFEAATTWTATWMVRSWGVSRTATSSSPTVAINVKSISAPEISNPKRASSPTYSLTIHQKPRRASDQPCAKTSRKPMEHQIPQTSQKERGFNESFLRRRWHRNSKEAFRKTLALPCRWPRLKSVFIWWVNKNNLTQLPEL